MTHPAVPDEGIALAGIAIAELRRLRNVSRVRAPLAIVVTWVGIGAVISFVVSVSEIWAYLLAAPLLGALQNRLTTLLHDAMHRSLHPKPAVSDFFGKWFCGYPCGNFFHINLIMHRNHHHEFGLKRDPNVLAYTVSRATFVKQDMPRTLLALGLFSALFNFNQKLANLFRYSEKEAAIEDAERVLKKEALAKDYLRLPLVQLALLAGASAAGVVWLYLYWVIVRVTLCAAYNAIRLFVEHHSDLTDSHPILANTADPELATSVGARLLGAVERFLIAPLHFNLHGSHHVAPFLPYYQLPELTRLIRARQLPYFLTRPSYLSYLIGKENFATRERDLLPITSDLRARPNE